MLIDLAELVRKRNLTITGVLHVGAHLGEEAEKYEECGIREVWWIEANPDLIAALYAHVEPFGHRVVRALVSDTAGEEVTFHVANNGQSSSILEFGTHSKVSPDVHYIADQVHTSTTIDALADDVRSRGYGDLFDQLNFLNMDLQGAELLALRGAEETLGQIAACYLEVNVDELYQGCARLEQLDEFLGARGFERTDLRLAGDQRRDQPNWAGWGDGLWVRT